RAPDGRQADRGGRAAGGVDSGRRGVLQHEPLRRAAALHAARGRVRHLQARARRRPCGGRPVPAHHASARDRLPFAHLDRGRADPPRPELGRRRRLVRDPRRGRKIRARARSLLIDNFSKSQVVRKRVVSTRGGVVASAHRRASEAGAAVLEAGGDAVDAAVATSFAIGVLEPWMSGLAAGGAMVLWRAAEQKGYVVDYGMRSPRALDPADYPLTGKGANTDLFAWPLVKDERNVEGATAVAVPGVVAGVALAHGKFGRMSWQELVAPAVALAREGMLIDWFAGLMIASNARALARDRDAAALYLEDGQWPPLGTWTAFTEKRLDQKKLAATLDAIGRDGAKALYGGDVGKALAKDIREKGGSLSLDDLSAYHASIVEPLTVLYRGSRVLAAPGFTGGPALSNALQILNRSAKPSYVEYAGALQQTWRARLQSAGDKDGCTTHF